MKTLINHKQHKLYLSKMQCLKYNEARLLSDGAAQNYLDSFLGQKSRLSYLKNYRFNEIKYFNTCKSLYQDFSSIDDTSPVPIYKSKRSLWVGVEIECFIDGVTCSDDESCEYCGGSNEVTCCNCEGDGNITLEDNYNYTYEVECQHCDGHGVRDCDECNGESSGNNNYRRDDFIYELKQNKITGCALKYDGSLGNEGIEITLIFDASKGFNKLERLCKILNKYNAKITQSCGLHVHIDRHNHADLSIENYNDIALRLADFVPQSRRENTYCKIKASESDRYSAINLCNSETIEYRLHTGSTNFNKISNWIKLLLSIKNIDSDGIKLLPSMTTKDDLYRALKLPVDLRAYFNSRYNQFNNINTVDDESMAS